jgi:hypothetical protein
MQDHGVHRDQFLALQPVDGEDRRLGEVESGQFGRDGIQPLHRTGIIVVVVADENFFRKPLDAFGIERQRLDRIGRGRRRRLRGGGLRQAHGRDGNKTGGFDELAAAWTGCHANYPVSKKMFRRDDGHPALCVADMRPAR